MQLIKVVLSLQNGGIGEKQDARSKTLRSVTDGNTIGIEKERLLAIDMLIEHGASPQSQDKTGRTPLHHAVGGLLTSGSYEGYKTIPLDIVEHLIYQGAVADMVDNVGNTALHCAVKSEANNSRECVQLLINNKAALEVRNEKLRTPLAIALENEREEIANELIRSGADVENTAYCSALKEFFSNGNYGIARFIISEGANINSQGLFDRTLLHESIIMRDEEMLKFLLGEGADVEIADNSGKTPLDFAIEQKNESAVGILKGCVRRSDAGVSNSNNDQDELCQKLHKAVLRGDEQTCRECIAQQADVNSCDSRGGRPLHHAASGGYAQICRLLIEAGAYVNVKDRESCTPLHYAVEGGHVDTCYFLLDKGASVHLTNNQGFTALHCAAASGDNEICLLLLKTKKMHEQKPTREGCSALHIACEHGHFEVVKELISHKASINAKNNTGWTPLHYAAYNGNQEICQELLKNNAKIDAQNDAGLTPLHCAVIKNHATTAHILMEQGAQTVIRNNQGRTPLLVMSLKKITKDKVELYKNLLAHSPELAHIAEDDGWSPLHFAACYSGALPLVTELLGSGASGHTRTNDGSTPLHFAADAADLSIVKSLLDKKASLHAKTNAGETPLMCLINSPSAPNSQKVAICDLLLNYGASPAAGESMYGMLSQVEELTKDDEELIALFFKRGVNVLIKNKYGYCSLFKGRHSPQSTSFRRISRSSIYLVV